MNIIKTYESFNNVINKSFNITNIDVDEYLKYLSEEYQVPIDNSYILESKKHLIKILTTDYSYDNNGVLSGIENFPNKIKLYRLIDNSLGEIKKSDWIGRSWVYDKSILYDKEFQSSVGFDESKSFFIIDGIFNINDIDVVELLDVLTRLTHEKEIRIKQNINPVSYTIEKYKNR